MTVESIAELERKAAKMWDQYQDVRCQLNLAHMAGLPHQAGDKVEAELVDGVWHPAIIRRVEMHSFGVDYIVSILRPDGKWSRLPTTAEAVR